MKKLCFWNISASFPYLIPKPEFRWCPIPNLSEKEWKFLWCAWTWFSMDPGSIILMQQGLKQGIKIQGVSDFVKTNYYLSLCDIFASSKSKRRSGKNLKKMIKIFMFILVKFIILICGLYFFNISNGKNLSELNTFQSRYTTTISTLLIKKKV